MSHQIRRFLSIAAVLGVGVAGGVVAAQAASSTTTVHACETSKGQLSLASSKGRCAQGSHGVDINKQGPRGATGRTGAPGRAGNNGVGATSAVIDLTTQSNAVMQTKTVGTFAGYVITISCSEGDTQLKLAPTQAAAHDLYSHGTLYNDSGEIDERLDGIRNVSYPAGDDPVLTDTSSQASSFTIEAYSLVQPVSNAPGQLLLTSATSTAVLDFYLYSGTTKNSDNTYTFRCQANAQLTPSTTQSN